MNKDEVVAILVGGGPAPGINGVISAVTIEAINNGKRVIGIFDGFKGLLEDPLHVQELKTEDVSRIHLTGGSILRTSRENPTKAPEKMERVLKALSEAEIKKMGRAKKLALVQLNACSMPFSTKAL